MTAQETRQIARLNELSQLARNSWVALLAYLAFIGITLLGVQDADFFVPSRETVLPLVAVRIPTASFFWFAPVLAAALYIYLHVHLLQLWDVFAEAPARVDGAPLGDFLHPWIGLDLALSIKGGGALRRRPLDWLVHLVSAVLIWFAAPLVLAGFWWRSMPAHDQWLGLTIAGGMLAAIHAGLASWLHAVARMRRPWMGAAEGRWTRTATLVAGVALAAVTWVTTERDLRIDRDTPGIGRLLGNRSLGTLVAANLTEVELVDLPDNWRLAASARLAFRRSWCDQEALPDDVCYRLPQPDRPIPARVLALREAWCAENAPTGANCAQLFADYDARFREDWREERAHARENLGQLDLAGRDLRRAIAPQVALVGADLSGARMQGADLRGARMEGVNLRNAGLEGALLRDTELEDAVLTGARLQGADLRDTWLAGALMPDAQLQGADLGEAVLRGAYLLNARLDGADLAGARLEGSDLTVASLERADLRTARLVGADLRGALLAGADFRWADLRSARWSGATLGASPAHYADFRGAADLTQAQLDALVGNAGTLLPDHPAPDTRLPYAVPSCWPEPPAGFDELVARLSGGAPRAAAELRATLLCRDGAPPQRTGTPCPPDQPREQCLAPWR